jgi:dihydroorotate dehydrogenase
LTIPTENGTQTGGLSGAPLKPLTLNTLRILRSHLPANIPIIGCGGISTGADALEYARAGATMVQVYTGFGYDGAGMCRRVKDEIVDALGNEGVNWNTLVNTAVSEKSLSAEEIDRRKRRELEVKEKAQALVGEGARYSEEDLGEVTKLIKEAEHIKALLDRFGEGLGKTDSSDSAVAAAEPIV